ncbi:HAD family hydrolase [Aliihoeflea sp. 40Bstr573]|uniref:HAD family hydrolase n=1 Tax=Aliihoeflea sp. 40Bstr573 TaxID=2696467 RepID=UPI00209514F7|nr:HAD family hydrolase [Aliihoeflea sp. 40Bstr573]MCO6385569.1 HAD-IA family hydrolase [Aliihoeflea sp. 40Bstr573]
MPAPIIVFDLDGTLVDTAPDLMASLNHCLALDGMTVAGPAEFRRFVGMGGKVMIERAYAAQQRVLSNERLKELLDTFIEHYGSNMPGESQPYEGVIAALDRFDDAGYLTAICTNKFEMHSTRLMQGLGLTERFRAICGQDTFAFRKPDPRHLIETIARAGGDPECAIMVGDSETDIKTAKAAGIPVVAVDFGYTDKHVREFEPSHIVSHFDELTVDLADRLIAAATSPRAKTA